MSPAMTTSRHRTFDLTIRLLLIMCNILRSKMNPIAFFSLRAFLVRSISNPEYCCSCPSIVTTLKTHVLSSRKLQQYIPDLVHSNFRIIPSLLWTLVSIVRRCLVASLLSEITLAMPFGLCHTHPKPCRCLINVVVVTPLLQWMFIGCLLVRILVSKGGVSDYAAPGPAVADQIVVETFLGVPSNVHFALC